MDVTNRGPEPPTPEWLHQEWLRLTKSLGWPREAAEWTFEELARRYAEPGRYYHNLEHVRKVLEVIADLREFASWPAAVELAGWFHDVVYDPRTKDNEERSTACAETVLQALGVPGDLVARVGQLILATKTHQALPDDRDCHVLLDADLAILGAPETAYAAYALAIRREYAWVPDDAYREGRSQVLLNCLSRERIFFTDAMHRALERRARGNLQSELESLRRKQTGRG